MDLSFIPSQELVGKSRVAEMKYDMAIDDNKKKCIKPKISLIEKIIE